MCRISICRLLPSVRIPTTLITGKAQSGYPVSPCLIRLHLTGTHRSPILSRKLIQDAVGTRFFHTTRPNHIPPALWVFLRPAANVAAILFGRRIRRWWQQLPAKRREFIIRRLRKYRWYLLATLCTYLTACSIYYVTHLERTPITGRLRFIAVTPEQYQEVSEEEFQTLLQTYQSHILDPSNPVCRRIRKMAERLLNANSHLQQIHDKKWSITVVDASSIENAFVLPNGQIFVFTGKLYSSKKFSYN